VADEDRRLLVTAAAALPVEPVPVADRHARRADVPSPAMSAAKRYKLSAGSGPGAIDESRALLDGIANPVMAETAMNGAVGRRRTTRPSPDIVLDRFALRFLRP
jgi:hypothetical protein